MPIISIDEQGREASHGRRSNAKAKAPERRRPEQSGSGTDGFHLVIDALKLNGLNTIYGVPGIPITDFGRMAQAAGIRVTLVPAWGRTPATQLHTPAS